MVAGGGGIVGLATAPEIDTLFPEASEVVLVKEKKHSSRLADSGADSSDSSAENNSKFGGFQQHASFASVLQKIVDRAGGKGPPLLAFLESVEYEASSVLKQVLNYQVVVEPKPNTLFGNWVEHLELLAPVRQSEESKLAVQNILQILNEKQDTQLQSIKTRLSVPDVVEVLKELENPTTAFMFYKWVRRQPFYIPHESIYAAMIEQLIASSEVDSWDQLHVVVNGMIKRRVFIDNLLFRRILKVLCVYGLKHPYSIPRTQRYVNWLLRMSQAGFVVWITSCRIVMKRCNILGMYQSTLSVFEGVPMIQTSTLTVALFACKGLNNLNLAEELVNRMKRKKIEPNAKCLSILVRLCADHGQADKEEMYSQQMKELGFSVDEKGE